MTRETGGQGQVPRAAGPVVCSNVSALGSPTLLDAFDIDFSRLFLFPSLLGSLVATTGIDWPPCRTTKSIVGTA